MLRGVSKSGVAAPAEEANNGSFEITIGVTESGEDLKFDLASPWHTAIQGMSRSGKSSLTYAFLGQLADRPGVIITGLDPTGVLLSPFRDHPRPDLRATGNSDMKQHASVIQNLTAEMDKRIASLHGLRTDKIDNFDTETPILLVALEEYPGVMSDAALEDAAEGRKPAQRIKPRIQSGVARLIKEGAKVGIRVLLLAQRMDAEVVGGSERSNFGNKITLRVDNADAVKMLHANEATKLAAVASRLLPGHGLVEQVGHPVTRFRGDYMDYGTYFDRIEAGRTSH